MVSKITEKLLKSKTNFENFVSRCTQTSTYKIYVLSFKDLGLYIFALRERQTDSKTNSLSFYQCRLN